MCTKPYPGLPQIRLGTCDEETEAFINQAARPLQVTAADVKPTKLYPLNRNVDYENNQHYNALDTEAITYNALDGHAGQNGSWTGGLVGRPSELVSTHPHIPARPEPAPAHAARLPGQSRH